MKHTHSTWTVKVSPFSAAFRVEWWSFSKIGNSRLKHNTANAFPHKQWNRKEIGGKLQTLEVWKYALGSSATIFPHPKTVIH
jgi:hypothetical protein